MPIPKIKSRQTFLNSATFDLTWASLHGTQCRSFPQIEVFRYLYNYINPLLPATVYIRVPRGQTFKKQSRDAYRRRWAASEAWLQTSLGSKGLIPHGLNFHS